MKLIIENTSKIVMVKQEGAKDFVHARIWEGETSTGIKVHCYITRIAIVPGENEKEFEKELSKQKAPSAAVEAIPLRLIL